MLVLIGQQISKPVLRLYSRLLSTNAGRYFPNLQRIYMPFYMVHGLCQETRANPGSRVEQSISIRYRLDGYPEESGFQRRRWLRTISTAGLHFSTASENSSPNQPSTVSPIDTSIVVVYLSGVALLGVYFSRRQKTTEDYFLAARSVPGWVVAFSILGTICGSATFVGHPGNVFHDNMFLIPAHLVPLIVMLLLARRIVVFYRHNVRMTAYEYLEQRFGYPARAYGAATFLVSRVADVSVTYYFLALATAVLTGWGVTGVILILGAVTVLYTLIGGIQAVVWTDVVQGIFLVGGGLLCILLILFGSDAAPSQILAAAWEGGKFEIDRWQWDAAQNNQWLLILGSIVAWLQSFCCNQHNVQRYLLARSDREAVRGAVMGAGACVPVWLLFMLLGALLWSYYQFSAEVVPPEVMAVKDRIVPHFVSTQFPAGLKGMVLAALIAAAMSSLDSDLNSLATVVVNDFFGKLRPRASESLRLLAGRISVVGLGAASILLALQWTRIDSASLVEFSLTMTMIFTGGILGLFALGMLFRWTLARGAYLGILACLLFTAWATLTQVRLPGSTEPILDLGSFNCTLSLWLTGVLGHLVLVAVAMAASLILRRTGGVSG